MKIVVDNTNYILNTKRAIELGVLTPDIVHTGGNRYRIAGEDYILVMSSTDEMALVSLNDGNRWADAVKVKWSCVDGHHQITHEEFLRVSNNQPDVEKIS